MKRNVYYLILPFAIAGAVVSASFADNRANNTERNVADRQMETVLPEDQSNEKVFLDRTAAIRKEIVQADNLSTEAKNVKIVTLDSGTVVLRGPVATPNEKEFIEDVAKRVSGGSTVQSFLEVM